MSKSINCLDMKNTRPELSVVILCYHSGESIFDFVRETKRIFKENDIENFELILVGNFFPGSDDNTPEIVKEIADNDKQISYVAKPKLGMMGWDMKSGLDQANGRYIAVIDGDGQMPIIDIVSVWKTMKEKNADVAKTYRMKRGDGLWRKLISFFYNLFFSILFPGLYVNDINSKPKIMTRDFYEKLNLKSDDWFIDAEIMIQARRFNAVITEIPTEFLGLSGERKSFVKLPAIFEFVKNLIEYRLKEFMAQRNQL